ncbi:dehydration-responsive element-binding protein 1D-like [Rutidosis leptorrhynchoides]|uniref:dehydration-responsive element-binding protein 1D-like n=1 Tax=Rutidosis leptorrhynchoides TaxID=125765 RepID=UPI003A9A1382
MKIIKNRSSSSRTISSSLSPSSSQTETRKFGTFPNSKIASRAYDVASLTCCDDSRLNCSDSARLIRRAKSSSHHDIKEEPSKTAYAFAPKLYHTEPCSSLSIKTEDEDDEMTNFVDEEVLFNMPSYYNSMAEGLVITPPGMKKGFGWSDDVDCNITEFTLW